MAFYDEDGNEVDPFDPEFQQQQEDQRNPLRQQVRRMEKQIKDLRKEAEAGQQAVKQLEFVKAGVDLTNPMAAYFARGYDGDVTAEAIKAAAEPLGLLGAKEPERQEPAQQDRPGLERMNQALQDGTQPAQRDYDAEMRAAKTPEEMDRIYLEKAQSGGNLPAGVPAIVND